MNLRNQVVDAAARGMNVLHRAVLTVSGGRILNTAFGMPTVVLHTVGRKTGARRSNMLTTPLHSDDRVVLVASKGGDDRHPEWYLNLQANPDVDLEIDGVTRPMTARTATDQERTELWPQIVAVYEGYAAYQRRTSRPIPVVICAPRA